MHTHNISSATRCVALALLAMSLRANAQEPRPFGFGNPPATAELKRLPQTPGARGDQCRTCSTSPTASTWRGAAGDVPC